MTDKKIIDDFKLNYGSTKDINLARRHGITLTEVDRIAKDLRLGQDKKLFPVGRMPRWRPEEVAILKDLYPTTPNIEIASLLGRTLKSVVSKAFNEKLKKDPQRLVEMGRENVQLRQDRQP